MMQKFNPDYLQKVIAMSRKSTAKFVYNFLGGCFTIQNGVMIPCESKMTPQGRDDFIRLSINLGCEELI